MLKKTDLKSALQTLNNASKRAGILNKILIENSLPEVNFDLRQSALSLKQRSKETLLPFVTTYHPAVQDLRKTSMA